MYNDSIDSVSPLRGMSIFHGLLRCMCVNRPLHHDAYSFFWQLADARIDPLSVPEKNAVRYRSIFGIVPVGYIGRVEVGVHADDFHALTEFFLQLDELLLHLLA